MVVYNGVSFYRSFWVGKSLREFLDHEKHHGLSDKQLEEAYFIINPGAKAKLQANGNNTANAKQGKGTKSGGDNKPVNIEDKK